MAKPYSMDLRDAACGARSLRPRFLFNSAVLALTINIAAGVI
jgi:hypothetical protein